MQLTDVMIDLETLGTAPGSVILSIGGAAVLHGGSLVASADLKIDVRDSLYHGLTVDPDTLAWWRKQNHDSWEESTAGKLFLRAALEELSSWIARLRKGSALEPTWSRIRIWGDGASFDPVLLEAAYRAAHLPIPWSYHEVHCYRTLRQLFKSEKPASKGQHTALSDATAQLSHLVELLALLPNQPPVLGSVPVPKFEGPVPPPEDGSPRWRPAHLGGQTDGGGFMCVVCGAAEGELTADGCPGVRLTVEEFDRVRKGGATATSILCDRAGLGRSHVAGV